MCISIEKNERQFDVVNDFYFAFKKYPNILQYFTYSSRKYAKLKSEYTSMY